MNKIYNRFFFERKKDIDFSDVSKTYHTRFKHCFANSVFLYKSNICKNTDF